MENTYVWSTDSIEVNQDTRQVVAILWRYTVTSPAGETASTCNRFDLETPVPLDGFTADESASLVQNDFGPSAMAALRARLDGMLTEPDTDPEIVSMQLPELLP